MAFVSSQTSVFFGTRAGRAVAARCGRPRVQLATSMVLEKPTLPNLDLSQYVDLDPPHVLPPYSRTKVKRGDTLSVVRTAVDDFTSSSYFQGLTGEGVRVAVVDTGVDPDHPALRDRIDRAASRNYTPDYNGDPSNWADGNAHGTHCAGIIAAEPRNAIMSGVAPGATIIAKKTIVNEDNERPSGETLLRYARVMRDCIREDVHVISMSLGLAERFFREYKAEMGEFYLALQEALAAGIVVVCAAGNAGGFTIDNTIEPPGAFGGVITVASHDDRGNRSNFSSFGGELDFMAPGEVFSTVPGGRYEHFQGTSMATPLVAGLCALLKEAGARADMGSLSRPLLIDMFRTGYRARNCYEVREHLRLLSESPQEHNRTVGYGRLVRAYEYVNEEIGDNF